MGLFSSKKVYVSSSAYNMAGDELTRPNFLKTAVISKIITEDRRSMAEVLQQNYLGGPGIRLRKFFNWARDNYDLIGMPSARLFDTNTISNSIIEAEIDVEPGHVAKVFKVEVGPPDFSYWADQWMLLNHPDLVETAWEADFVETTGDIQITFEDTTTETFTPADFVESATYLYATYTTTGSGEIISDETGTEITLGDGAPWPNTTGWTGGIPTIINRTVVLNTNISTHVDYSDTTPDEDYSSSTSEDADYDYKETLYERITYRGNTNYEPLTLDVDGLVNETETMWFIEDYIIETVITEEEIVEDLGGGVTKTTTTTTSTDTLVLVRKYRTDSLEQVDKTWYPAGVFIYKYQSGNSTLDDLIENYGSDPDSQYYPFIPIRLDNEFLSETHLPDAYALSKKAFKKSIDGDIEEVFTALEENENLKDIDYAYIVFGVSLNVREDACKKYLFKFFDKLRTTPGLGSVDYPAYEAGLDSFLTSNAAWNEWKEAQSDELDPLFGAPEPVIADYPSSPTKEFRIRSTGSIPSNYDILVSWLDIKKVTGSGEGKPGAKRGDLWFDANPPVEFDYDIYSKTSLYKVDKNRKEVVRLYYQIDDNNWEALDLYNLVHRNFIYKGKYVETWASDALASEEESGFIIPIHNPTFKEMSLVDSTQMGTACVFLVLNSYLVKKTGFFGSTFFKIFKIILVIVVTVTLGPQAGMALGNFIGVDLIGDITNALGISIIGKILKLGLTGIGAIIVMKVLTEVSVAIFGEKFGRIFAAIAVTVALTMAGNAAAGSQIFNINQFMQIDKIMSMTSAIGGAMAQNAMNNAMEYNQKTKDTLEEYSKQSKEISEKYIEEFGLGTALINPLDLINDPFYFEDPESFLGRTLMTGTDLIELQMGMISEFTDLTLANRLL